jgi:hypothetical protein
MKETLQTDVQQIDTDISIIKAKLDNARNTREQGAGAFAARRPSSSRSILARVSASRRTASRRSSTCLNFALLADVDELNVGRIAAGGKVEVTFRGSPTVYMGTISRVAPTVKRMQRMEPDGGSSTDARVVQVEIQLDDPSSMPQVLGRETRVTFL